MFGVIEPVMSNGKPVDHPLTDIFAHKLAVYGPEADELIRKIGALCSDRELDEWWEHEISWTSDREPVLRKTRIRYGELAKESTREWLGGTMKTPNPEVSFRLSPE